MPALISRNGLIARQTRPKSAEATGTPTQIQT